MKPSALAAAAVLLALAGCSAELDERSVRRLYDDADRAYLKGDVNAVCDLRTPDFKLDSTTLELARGRVVADRAEADAIEADATSAGFRTAGTRETLDRRQFCMMAFDGRDAARGARLERGAMQIALDPSGRRATVKVRYVVLEPDYQASESGLGDREVAQQQVASRRTESEEESVIVLDGREPRFASTRATNWTFRVPAVRDSRL